MAKGLLMVMLCLVVAFSAWASGEIPRELHEVLWRVQEEVKVGHWKEALGRLEGFKRKHPQKRHYLLFFYLGNVYWRLGRKEEAVRCWLEATELNPSDWASWQNLARAYYDEGRFLEAAHAFERAWKITGNAELRFYEAVSLLKAGRPEAALPHLHGLLQGGKAEDSWLQALLQADLELGRLEGAEEALSELLQRHPERPDYWRWLARVRLRRGRHLEAARALEVALRLRDDPEVRRELADLYQAVGLWIKAAQHLKRLHPDPSAEVCDQIAGLYLMAGRPSEALKYLDLALAKAPTRERFLKKGEILFSLRRFKEAYEAFGKALFMGDDGYACLMMGYCAWYVGDWEGAQKAWRKAASHPSYRRKAEEALRMIAQVEGTTISSNSPSGPVR